MSEETTPAADAAEERGAAARHDAPSDDNDNLATSESDEQSEGTADDEDDPSRSFEEMRLDADVLRALDDMGYDKPMEVQDATYDAIREGRDIMVQARTGTGKTAAFGIPLAQVIHSGPGNVEALILCPTRELAMQVAREMKNIVQYKGQQVVAIYGGAPMKPQVNALEAGARIVAGTPGRVLDHIGRRTLKTGSIKHLVLDECDEMLSMGFQEEIERIIDTLPPKEVRQTMLFSATIPSEIQRIARRHMKEPVEISLSEGGISVDQIDHHYYIVTGMKTKALLQVLETYKPEQAIIFCNTREDTTLTAKYLQRQGLDALAISSDLSQRERERVMKKMREGNVRFMCATDVAARGIDIESLPLVVNYGFPESPEVYVHRTGRTGRAGNRGVAVSLIGPREIGSFYFLKLTYKIEPEERELPTAEEFAAMLEADRYEKIVNWVNEEAPEEFKSLARRLWQSEQGERVVGALLRRLFNARDAEVIAGDKPEPAEGETYEQERAERPRRFSEERGGERGERGRRRRSRRDDRDGDRDSRRRPRRDDGDEARADKPTTDADEARADEATEAADTEGESQTRAEGSEGEGSEGGERKRRRRRRRRRSGEGEGSSDSGSRASSSGGDDREFWETWADEKSARASSESDGDEASEEADDNGGTARLYLNIGKREEVSADDVRALLGEWLGDDAEQIGAIALRNTHCYVRVPEGLVNAVIASVEGKTYKERDVVIERARR